MPLEAHVPSSPAINRNASLNGAPNPRGHWDHKSLQAEATTSSKPRAWCSFLWRLNMLFAAPHDAGVCVVTATLFE